MLDFVALRKIAINDAQNDGLVSKAERRRPIEKNEKVFLVARLIIDADDLMGIVLTDVLLLNMQRPCNLHL